eukprot:TRINITY_DN24279_c1_g1_i2.p1 TRINITY_DN24279_c1_g1~~TRINITY_DN24279_c1_g1_i2.p1  ORF type:complete len:432 (+),score=69.26 TRINITY_DN24279_c1_g1_i2:61-1356(+)
MGQVHCASCCPISQWPWHIGSRSLQESPRRPSKCCDAQHDLEEEYRRLAPSPFGGHVQQVSSLSTEDTKLPVFVWEEVLNDTSGIIRSSLCKALATRGFALLAPSPVLSEHVSTMQHVAAEFFERPSEERYALGKLRLYRDKVVGYRELGSGFARFLEVHALSGGGSIPRVKTPKQLGQIAVKIHQELQVMSRELLSWLADHAGVPREALLQCIDEAKLENLQEGDCSASVLRLCSYGFESEFEPTAPEDSSSGEGVVSFFDEHTDASFLTLAPVGSVPGLQFRNMLDPNLAWLDVESGLGCHGQHLIVFVGDFLEVLTKGEYTAARHRVAGVLKENGTRSSRRLSMPFLVRGQPNALMDTTRFLDSSAESKDGASMPLLRLEGMRYSALRHFLDLKGRRRFRGTKLLLPAGVAADDTADPQGLQEKDQIS